MLNVIKLAGGLMMALMLGGCVCCPLKEAAIAPEADGLRGALNEYLAHYAGAAGFGGVVFAGYDVVKKEEDGALSKNYIWVVCQEYYMDDGNVRRGTEISVPAVVTLARSVNDYRVMDFKMPARVENIQKLSVEYAGYDINGRTGVIEGVLLNHAVKYFEVCAR
ncbi:MAG: hypothetical protein A2219_07500 [Elusimicrobia bacterium RIFOXYA2_FULL_50_26]|nr:MAG: hypothetical protein A2219_07500 [Elusimicrobia bacterium RIFOXYA2_FULL_50_26]